MQPDLIIISGRQSDYQEQLSQIAPTLYLAMDAEKAMGIDARKCDNIGKDFDKRKEAEEN